MDKSQDRPCCLCDVEDGDASPMKVKAPEFCKKTVGQKTPYPCANNTLIVTLSATTNLPGNISTITMAGFNGGIASTGPLPLTDQSGGQGNNLRFAASLGGEPGYGNWNDATKILTLQVIETLECGGEYLFSFVLTNQNDGQSPAPGITISANNLHLYHPKTTISASLMDSDVTGLPVPRSSPGDAAPLLIWNPVFTVQTIFQSTSGTCIDNTISVSLKSTVPLLAACQPVLTLTGLTNSDTPELSLDIVPISASQPFEQLGEWHQGSGTLKIRVTSDSIETDDLSFSFKLRNPARGNSPDPAGVKVEVTQGIVFSRLAMVSQNVSDYPLTVDQAKFKFHAIGQSSSWPCDLNTITGMFIYVCISYLYIYI